MPRQTILTVVFLCLSHSAAFSWDSYAGNPVSPMHTSITEWALEQVEETRPALYAHREAIIEGANAEFGEGAPHAGQQTGTGYPRGWWDDAADAYRAGNKPVAYLYLGCLLHYVQDMFVPARAHGTPLQAPFNSLRPSAPPFDSFEVLAFRRFRPNRKAADRPNPRYDLPWKYYMFAREWTLDLTGDYESKQFPRSWTRATHAQRQLVADQQGRACVVTLWTLLCADDAFRRLQPVGDEGKRLLIVSVQTRRQRGAGCDDLIYFGIGKRDWYLNLPAHNDFESGKRDVFRLANVARDEIKRLTLRRGTFMDSRPWAIEEVTVQWGDEVVYRTAKPIRLTRDAPGWSVQLSR